MSELLPLPKPPNGVEYALTVPQSVLFADLSLRGSFTLVFNRIFGINYAPRYIVVDDGAMRWDFSDADPFNQLLSSKLNPEEVAQKFITITARTSRNLVRTAQVVSSHTRWNKSEFAKNLLDDLNTYWNAYEDHMSSLYTFWNVENLLTESLITALKKADMQEEIEAGMPTFVSPSEPNYFAIEQRDLAILKSRFKNMSEDEMQQVAKRHADTFGFLLAPFNLGTPSIGEDVIKRMEHITEQKFNQKKEISSELPEDIVRLGCLERELTFWKTERLDAFALADQYAMPMYKALSSLLKLPLKLVFCMTRDELTKSIIAKREVPDEILNQRAEKYCIALIDGKISFYEPTKNDAKKNVYIFKDGDVIKGIPTSPGIVRGRVKIINPGDENPILEPDEIIVTGMTRPELGAALDVALAYVTDEGGRLCHASIVSREKKKPCIVGVRLNHAIVTSKAKNKPCVVGARLNHAAIVSKEKNKPCVVGTRKATEVLQDGMLIEVDGSKGTVTVL